MHSKKLALAVLAAALLSTTAIAQSNPPASSSAPAATKPMSPTAIQSTNSMGQWRASKLIGLNVYNANNEKIGDINELVTDSSGKIDTVVIGVGGFVGIGEHNVGIPFAQVKFLDEPVKSSSTTTTNNGARTTGSAATTTTTTSTAKKDYPDHAMVNMTKDQLKALPAFKYASDTSSTRTTTTTAPAPAPAARAPATPPANQAPTAPSAR
jgi:sporulation protein YlmC with PRC-barrel domain